MTDRFSTRCVFPDCVEGEKPALCGKCYDAERAEAAEARVAVLEAALRAYHEWASRMPDAGFNDTSPRWAWWRDLVRVVLGEQP